MDPTRVAGASAAGGLSARAKGAAAASLVPKRKRGALQDISNSHARGSAATAASASTAKKPLAKPLVKPASNAPAATRGVKRSASSMSQSVAITSTTANVRVRGVRVNGVHPNVTTKRRRENVADGDHAASAKVQTKLLSFKALAPSTKSVSSTQQTKSEPSTTEVQEEIHAQTEIGAEDPEMECHEMLKPETSQPEPTPSAITASAEEEKTQAKPHQVEPVQSAAASPQSTGEVPPYKPRPYVFKFDHRDSGFDEETYRSQVRDIDEPFRNSAIHCVNIACDMDRFHRQHQDKYHPTPDYIGNVQLDINEKMRTILIDWLVEVGEEYELDSQTFHKTVNLVDRCLAKFKINRKQFQLLGCACMMIAAKFEEVYGPNVDEFVYISDQTYTSEEMLEMEIKVLQALEYRIASTTCHGFLPRFTRAGCSTDKQKSLVQYLCDFAMLYYHMLEYRPSMLAAAAVYLSRLMTNEEQPWTPTLHHITQYNAWELKACVMDLYRLHLAECEIVETQRDKAKAVSEKYVSEKFHGVSATPSVDEAVLEQSFLAYEQPLSMRCKPKQESSSASAESSGSEE